MTAGMAATRPMAVATSASAMPGATVARLAAPFAPMLRNEFMMPHTVPNRPMNGAALAVVPSSGTRLSISVVAVVRARDALDVAEERVGGRLVRRLVAPLLQLGELRVAGPEHLAHRGRRRRFADPPDLVEAPGLPEGILELGRPGRGVREVERLRS